MTNAIIPYAYSKPEPYPPGRGSPDMYVVRVAELDCQVDRSGSAEVVIVINRACSR